MTTKLRRTLFIGLGGTGMSALLHTKKVLYDTYGEIPPMLGFLGIDTDGDVYNRSLPAKDGTLITLTTSEQLPICVNTPDATYMRTPDKYDWLPACNASALDNLRIGAGQVRSNGRFAVTIREEDVTNSVNAKIRQINSASIIDNPRYTLLGTDTEIHMVFSLGGGTGCGTFINMAYLLNRTVPGAKLSGYAVMADVFRAMMQGAGVARVRANAMGAIIDLDYLMHLNPASEPVEIKWLKDSEKVHSRPFDAFYFIDNRSVDNNMFSNVDQLCEMISLALVTSTGELSVATASVSDNVAKQIGDGTMDIRDKKAWAAGFGVSEILFNPEVPADIYKRKASRQIITRMLNGGCDDPSIIANAWIDNTRIRENNEKDDVIDYFMPGSSPRTFSDIDSPENPIVEVDHFIDNIAMEKRESLNEKLDTLTRRVDIALGTLMNEQANRECGIYLCEHILKAILNQVELCDSEMKSEIEEHGITLTRRRSTLESTCRELAETRGIFSGHKRRQLTAEVCELTMQVARVRREIMRREMAREFYNWLRTRVSASFDRVNAIVSNLKAVTEECASDIERTLMNLGNNNFFQYDLTPAEAEKVNCPMSDIVFNDFIHYMKGHGGVQSIASMTAAETSQIINNFCDTLPKVGALRDLTIDSVVDRMTDDEFSALCMKAMRKAEPLFTYTYRGYDADVKSRPMDSFYVGVADKAVSRFSRGGFMKSLLRGGANVDFSTTGIKDRVIIYRQIGVVPPFTLTAIDNYRPEYERFEESKEATSHWDNEMFRRMRKERFRLEPTDGTRSDGIGLWTFAIISGIVTFDPKRAVYRMRSKALGGKPITGFMVDLGKTRPEAYRTFEDNLDIIEPEISAMRDKIGLPGDTSGLVERFGNAKKSVENNTYLQAFSMCPYTLEQLEDPRFSETFDLINNEMTYIMEEL